MQEIYGVKGMHCQSCVRKIEQGMASFAKTVRVSLSEAQLYLTDPLISFDTLKNRLAEIGAYELVPQNKKSTAFTGLQPYLPLLLIVSYLAVASCASMSNVSDWMRHFMAGFFLVFSFFKLLNIRAFADGYAKYDLLAMRWQPYGFVYPFCELGLGLAYLFDWRMQGVLLATLTLTLFSACGVIQSMRQKQEIRCACLGNLLNVPLSTVTLIEDLGMAAMAVFMLIS
jgi:copper chaperone CopZ